MYLEDESGRVKLFGKGLEGNSLVTGVVACFLGYETPQGDFEVVEVCFITNHCTTKNIIRRPVH